MFKSTTVDFKLVEDIDQRCIFPNYYCGLYNLSDQFTLGWRWRQELRKAKKKLRISICEIVANKLTLKITNSLIEVNYITSLSLASCWFLKKRRLKQTVLNSGLHPHLQSTSCSTSRDI